MPGFHRVLNISEYFLNLPNYAWICWNIRTTQAKWHSSKILSTTIDFLSFREQRVVLNRQVSQWISIEAGVPQGAILGPLLFFIYINDVSDDLSTNAKLFADDTFLFSVVRDINTSSIHLNNNLKSKCQSETIFSNWKSFKNDEKWFLFHDKSSFRFQDIYVFVLTLWSCIKNGLIRKTRLILKFVMSQSG